MALVETELADGIGVITLNDPDRRNSFFAETIDELVAAVAALEQDESCNVLIVTGAPPAFCGGASLAALDVADSEALRGIYAGFLAVANSPLPTIAAVNGPAVGAGMNLALACDVRLMGESGTLDTRFLRLGIHPGGGHTWMLRNLVGPQTAAALVLFGEVAKGEDAVRLGLAHSCFPDDELLDGAKAFAARAAGADRELAIAVKRTLKEMVAVDSLADAVTKELAVQAWSMGRPAFREGLAATQRRISGSS